MAKNTKNSLDEVEIIRRRDGVVGATPLGPLDAHARRELTDSRLRALALSLSIDQTSHDADDPDDTELLAYLLEMLPEQRRREVEIAIRGNARAFGRLMTLRAAFNTRRTSGTGVGPSIPPAIFLAELRVSWRFAGWDRGFSFETYRCPGHL